MPLPITPTQLTVLTMASTSCSSKSPGHSPITTQPTRATEILYLRTRLACCAIKVASSLHFAFINSGSIPLSGHRSIFACRGGGSLAITSNCAARTLSAKHTAAPYSVRSPATYSAPIFHRSSRGSAPWRYTEVLLSFGFGRKAAGFTPVELN